MNLSQGLSVVIMAAGKGTRMKSNLPKVLHRICGKPLIYYTLKAAYELNPKNVFVVVGHEHEMVSSYILSEFPQTRIIDQEKQLGTGHAIMTVAKNGSDFGDQILILSGDTPFITGNTLKDLMKSKVESSSKGVLLTATMPDPYGFGRIIKDPSGNIIRIVEESDASAEEKKIKEVNSSIYFFDRKELFNNIINIKAKNAQGEYYLTDIVELFINNGLSIHCHNIKNYTEITGINDRYRLAAAEKFLQDRIKSKLVKNEATFKNSDTS